MGTGYTRQSAADIQTGEDVLAAPLNAEFNALQSAFNATTGHSHDGTSGEGPQISLTSSISGILPVANGGFAGIHNVTATTAPLATDDVDGGYVVGSHWLDTTNDVIYICIDNSDDAAVWVRVLPYDAGLADIAGLAVTDGNIIVGNGTNWVAESGATARTSLGLGSLAIASTISNADWSGTDLAVTNGGTGASDASTARTNLGVAIGSDVQAYNALLADIAGLTVAEGDLLYVNATGDIVNLAAGTDGYFLTLASGVPAWVASSSTVNNDNWSGTDLAVTNGGTGASDAATARTNLGLAIGTDVQAYDADLATIAAANNGSVLAATTASFTTTDETKLDNIEALADVTDTANVTAAGALMDSELADEAAVKAFTTPLIAYTSTVTDDGTKSTGTYTPTPASGGQYKKAVNGGAFTLAPYSPSNNEATTLSVLIVNNASAGAITTSGFTMVTGDSFDTTNTNAFLCRIEVVDYGGTEVSTLDVVALQ